MSTNSYQSIPVDPLAFVHPQKHKLLRRFELVWLCHKQSLEHVAEMSDVELVVEVSRCLPEIGSNLPNQSGNNRKWSCCRSCVEIPVQQQEC